MCFCKKSLQVCKVLSGVCLDSPERAATLWAVVKSQIVELPAPNIGQCVELGPQFFIYVLSKQYNSILFVNFLNCLVFSAINCTKYNKDKK